MENLKFRAWDKKTKLMNDVTVIDFENEEVYYKHWRYGHSEAIAFSDIELLQSTGLKDKNDVEIFEGDIVVFNDESDDKYIVCKFLSCFGIRFSDVGFVEFSTMFDGSISTEDAFTVLGNVFEDKELLDYDSE